MKNLTREQAIEMVNDLLKEDLTNKFNEQADNAGEHGDPIFVVSKSQGNTYAINEDFNSE